MLIISGIGKVQTAAAMGYAQALTGHQPHQAWLNIGIAGHATLPLGTGLLAHQIVDQANGRRYYPVFVIDRPVKTDCVWTVDRPETSYTEEGAYDMEAAACYAVASRFTTAELIHCYKVISDNPSSPPSHLTPQHVEELLSTHLSTLESIIHQLLTLNHQLQALELSPQEIEPFLTHWHFTSSQQHQLKRCLIRWKACSSEPIHTLWDECLLAHSNSRYVIHHLEKKLTTACLN